MVRTSMLMKFGVQCRLAHSNEYQNGWAELYAKCATETERLDAMVSNQCVATVCVRVLLAKDT